MADVIVIGSGVSGLSTAIRLAEARRKVVIWTALPARETSSAVAGAMWGPYLVEPREQVLKWSRSSLAEFARLAAEPGTGVRMVTGIEAARIPMAAPPWSALLGDFDYCGDLPEGFIDGYRFTVPLIDMPVYLAYLEERFRTSGGKIEIRMVKSLDEVSGAKAVVNCSGLGARALVPDDDLHPIRGDLVIVENPGIEEFFTEDTGLSTELCCIYPHGTTVVLGGTARDGDWDVRPDPECARHIVSRCSAIFPALAEARVIAHRVGLRPTRTSVRVGEDGAVNGVRVIHNYGHGGAGVTLSWGCADAVRDIVTRGGERQ